MTVELKPGDVVVIAAFDEIPAHTFRIAEVLEDVITGVALTGPLAGEYGEPDREMIQKIVSRTAEEGSQGSS